MSSPIVIKVDPKERRSEDRVIYCEEVNVTAFNPDGIALYMEGVQCVEGSEHGVRLSLSVRIPPGQRIMISATRPGLEASNAAFEVIGCQARNGGYQLGGKLISSTEDWKILS